MKAAIIGTGRIGYEFGLDNNRPQPASHFHCYQKLGAEIAVCDSDRKKIDTVSAQIEETQRANIVERETKGIKGIEKPSYHFSTSYKRVFDFFQPEIVSICTPTSTHKEIALAAANCPSVQTIFLEKPIAQSLGEADEILFICNKNNVRLAVNYSRRWSKNYAKMRKEMLLPVNLIGMHPGPLIRTGTHMIDVFHLVVGADVDWDNVEVQAFGETKLASYMSETEDFNINGYINYGDSKAVLAGNVQSVNENAVVFELTAWTKDIEFKVTENGCRTEIFGLSESKRYANLLEYRRCSTSEDEPENLLLNAISDLIATRGPEFLGGCYGGREIVKNACSGLDARRDLQVALALHYSATHGNNPVKLKDVPYEYTVRSY